MEYTYNKNTQEECTGEFSVKTTNGAIVIDGGDIGITLFTPKMQQDPDKKSEILFNAAVRLKIGDGASINFKAPVVKIKESGNLLIGNQSSSSWGHRAIISRYIKETKQSYDDMSISSSLYQKIMGILNTALSADLDTVTTIENVEAPVEDGCIDTVPF